MCAASRPRSPRLLILVMIAGCGGGSLPPAATPRPTPTPTPEPSGTPAPWSSGWANFRDNGAESRIESELVKTCREGTPVAGAAPYAGTVHPLLVMDMDNWWLADVAINRDFPGPYGWSWPSPIQLVLCYELSEKSAGSCGLYKSGETVAEVLRKQGRATIRVVVAATGKMLQKKVITNAAPKCPKTFKTTPGNWVLVKPVTAEQINRYATSVSKQTVK